MTSLNIANLMNSGTDAGFEWEEGEVSYQPTPKGDKVSLGQAPHAKVTDVAKFEAAFPGVILGALNGTSIKVACQAATRRVLLKNRHATDAELRTAVLNALRGIKNRSTVVREKVYVWGGKEFPTQDAAEAFAREALAAKGLDAETVESIVSTMFAADYTAVDSTEK